jgi:hypothetical protein
VNAPLSCEFAEECFVRRAHLAGLTDHPKRKGELAELVFVLKASSFGLPVSKPYGDSLPFDLVVQTGDGRMVRVQVKSAFTSCRWGYQVVATARSFGRRRLYTADDIDFLVAYIAPYDAWYIIPIEAIGEHRQIRFYPNGRGKKSGGLFEIYREAWHLLTGKRDPGL